MTQEEKNLVIKDLCARVPYVQFVYVEWNEPLDDGEDEPNIHTLTSCNLYGECILDDGVYKMNDNIKPYLLPMSSMTEGEKKVFNDFLEFESEYVDVDLDNKTDMYDWLNKNKFDYRGLIEKGLALEAPEGMYE